VSNPDIVHTTDATFSQDVLKSDKPVLLDFWAEWCGPCKMIAPILDEIATEYKDKLRVAKIDIESNPQTPPKFGIRNIPTLILFKNGTVEAQKVGSVRKPDHKTFLDAHLGGATWVIRDATALTKVSATAAAGSIAIATGTAIRTTARTRTARRATTTCRRR
jgi:thioredoxin 1